MKQNKQFDNILNECLDRIFRGEPIDKCLQDYPGLTAELEPLLRTAMAAKIAANIQPRAEFKARARYEFMAALQEKQAKRTPWWSFLTPVFPWQKGWAISLIVVLVVILGGGGVVIAAGYSMPDSLLYSVKLSTEQVQLAVTPSDIGKAELNAKFADRRTDEIAYMAGKDDPKEVQVAALHLNTNLENMTNLAVKDSQANKGGANNTFNAARSTAGSGPNAADTNQSETGALQEAPPTFSGLAAAPDATPIPAPVAPPAPSMAPRAPAVKALAPTSDSVGSGVAGSEAGSGAGVPTPSITVAAPMMAPNNTARNNNSNTANSKTADQEKLKQIIVDNYNNRQSRLTEALNKAPSSVRPVLRQTLAKSQSEFEKALANLDQGNSAN